MNRFVSSLRTRADGIRLASAAASTVLTLRAQCAEAWDAVRIDVAPETRVRDIKQAALSLLMPDVDDIDAYVVKLNGFEIHDENLAVQYTGAVDGSTFLIISRRRRPVR